VIFVSPKKKNKKKTKKTHTFLKNEKKTSVIHNSTRLNLLHIKSNLQRFADCFTLMHIFLLVRDQWWASNLKIIQFVNRSEKTNQNHKTTRRNEICSKLRSTSSKQPHYVHFDSKTLGIGFISSIHPIYSLKWFFLLEKKRNSFRFFFLPHLLF